MRRLVLVLFVVVLAGCGGGGASDDRASSSAPPTGPSTEASWQRSQTGWVYQGGEPPACPDPLEVPAPVDVHDATAILYPGQTRGEYKPHGGFRFDGHPNEVDVRAPLAGVVVRGTRYLVEGKLQSGIDMITPCGIMVRLGHIAVLTPEVQARFEELPAPTDGDSRSHLFSPPIELAAGDLVATAVGLPGNTSLDFGVYDLRHPNAKSADAAWAATHDPELAQHATCWLDLLPAAEQLVVKALPPGDHASGKTSDFCT